mgnify:CR=1 FL=1
MRAFIRLIIELIRPQRRSYNLQGLYLKDDTPRVIGTKLRRSRYD